MTNETIERDVAGDTDSTTATVELYWIPLGAGQVVAKASGKIFEALSAAAQRRRRCDLYHSALIVSTTAGRFVIEMTPIADGRGADRGVVAEGAVGMALLGRFRLFRYEIRRWNGGVIPDLSAAVSRIAIAVDEAAAGRLLDCVPAVPTPVWGRDELHAGDMWNSNSVVSWVLVRSGIGVEAVALPSGGRAPGWTAGLAVADREADAAEVVDGARHRRRRTHLFAQVVDVLHDLPVFVTAPLYRRWHCRWGATQDEVAAPMPGDDLVTHAQFRTTRSITIDAPPERVWPWLVQVGCGRAGWYSNDLLDNLARPSATTILPQWQHLHVGDWVPMSPSPTPTDRTAFRVHSFETNRSLLWSKPDSTWVWQLTPVGDGRTRLVTRCRALYDWRHPMNALVGLVLMEFGDFAMQRRMLRGIKQRAEALDRKESAADVAERRSPG